MNKLDETKLNPRNAPAFRKVGARNPTPHLVAGNPISTRLESSIGNCFPGLECDLRNLERRFFPFLEMDMPDQQIVLFKVDIEAAEKDRDAGKITKADLAAYRRLHTGGHWIVETMSGTFGPLGRLKLTIADLPNTSTGPNRLPPDPWTAVRLLTEGTDVDLVLHDTTAKPNAKRVRLKAKREAYLGDDGALAAMFVPGELTQSLCSPWTHDFRDCACFYWASNHPDIAMPPLPSGPTTDPKWNRLVPWERRDRIITEEPPPSASEKDPTPVELQYFEINKRWQSLNFVLERREQIGPYAQRVFNGKPLDGDQELEAHLRYAAGVELAVTQEYLAAAFSLKPDDQLARPLVKYVSAARAEIMRIAIGEMRHLRAVNDVLGFVLGRARHKPALGVATEIPGVKPGQTIPVQPRALTKAALESFIAIEAPSQSVDSVYARILATLNRRNNDQATQAIRTVMAEGEDHYETFLAIKEWLHPFEERQYLRSPTMKRPPATDKDHIHLQKRYANVLNHLYDGYSVGMPGGAADLNAARDAMIRPPPRGAAAKDEKGKGDTLYAAAEAVSRKGFLVVFDKLSDPKFTPVKPPSKLP
jgi:hypothetical protein